MSSMVSTDRSYPINQQIRQNPHLNRLQLIARKKPAASALIIVERQPRPHYSGAGITQPRPRFLTRRP
jgi:hypothetical protein